MCEMSNADRKVHPCIAESITRPSRSIALNLERWTEEPDGWRGNVSADAEEAAKEILIVRMQHQRLEIRFGPQKQRLREGRLFNGGDDHHACA